MVAEVLYTGVVMVSDGNSPNFSNGNFWVVLRVIFCQHVLFWGSETGLRDRASGALLLLPLIH